VCVCVYVYVCVCVCVCVCVAQIEKSLPSPQVNEEELVRCESIDALQELTELLVGAGANEENIRIVSAGKARATSAVQQTMQAEQEEMDEDAWAVEEADMIKRSLAAQREAVFSPSPCARARTHTHSLSHTHTQFSLFSWLVWRRLHPWRHVQARMLLLLSCMSVGEGFSFRRRILVLLTPWNFCD